MLAEQSYLNLVCYYFKNPPCPFHNRLSLGPLAKGQLEKQYEFFELSIVAQTFTV